MTDLTPWLILFLAVVALMWLAPKLPLWIEREVMRWRYNQQAAQYAADKARINRLTKFPEATYGGRNVTAQPANTETEAA